MHRGNAGGFHKSGPLKKSPRERPEKRELGGRRGAIQRKKKYKAHRFLGKNLMGNGGEGRGMIANKCTKKWKGRRTKKRESV